jgi:hypothetical protein
MTTCKIYANRGSAFALRQLLGLPFIDDAAGKFLFRKAYSYCVLQDEVPELTFTHEEQPIVDGLPPPAPPVRPGSVPATDPADAPVDAPAAPKAKATKTASTDQALCVRHHMRTVYTGRHWNCRK